MKYDSIGFDLDGTLWNATEAITLAWQKTAEIFNARIPDINDIKGILGLNKIDLMNKLYPDMEYETQMQFFDKANEICDEVLASQGGQLFDGLEETLKTLQKDFSLYIVSNCQDGYIERFLDYHKLGKYFCDSEHPDARCLSKGENIKSLLERNGFKKTIFVGDTQGDCDAARFAGVPFVFVSYGFGKAEAPDYTINTFPEIIDIVM
jgi:phosphoglycolate phosphatase